MRRWDIIDAMRKIKKILLSLAVVFASCRSSKNVISNNNSTGNPFGETYEMPCAVYDTDTDFAATGIALNFKF